VGHPAGGVAAARPAGKFAHAHIVAYKPKILPLPWAPA
jgi:hypothetical protein